MFLSVFVSVPKPEAIVATKTPEPELFGKF